MPHSQVNRHASANGGRHLTEIQDLLKYGRIPSIESSTTQLVSDEIIVNQVSDLSKLDDRRDLRRFKS